MRKAPLIISLVDCMIWMYLGETTWTFMMEFSVGRARHDTVESGIDTINVKRIYKSSRYLMLRPRARHVTMVNVTTPVSDRIMRRACSVASRRRRASRKTGIMHVIFVFASNTKVVAIRFREALSCSSFDGMYLGFILRPDWASRTQSTRPLHLRQRKSGDNRIPIATLACWKAAIFSELRMFPMHATMSPSS